MRVYTQEDCVQQNLPENLMNRVLVLPENETGQLFFCQKDAGDALQTVSLKTGEVTWCRKQDVMGLLRPELLPDSAKLQLSQIRPAGAADLSEHTPQYSGYSFLPDGRYAAGVWLCSPEEVRDYVQMQKDYQHRVLICDRNDFAVMEIVEGKLVFPSEQDLQAFPQQPEGGIQRG